MARYADLVSQAAGRDWWIPAAELRELLADAPADERLLVDLAEVRAATIDGP